jgi:hypothetical protein
LDLFTPFETMLTRRKREVLHILEQEIMGAMTSREFHHCNLAIANILWEKDPPGSWMFRKHIKQHYLYELRLAAMEVK